MVFIHYIPLFVNDNIASGVGAEIPTPQTHPSSFLCAHSPAAVIEVGLHHSHGAKVNTCTLYTSSAVYAMSSYKEQPFYLFSSQKSMTCDAFA